MTEDEVIAVTLALIGGGDPYIVRRQVERLERLLPGEAWSARMVRAGFATMAAPATPAQVLAGRDRLRAYAETAGVSLRWWPARSRLVIDLGELGPYGGVAQVMQVEEDIAGIIGRSVEVLMTVSAVEGAHAAELQEL